MKIETEVSEKKKGQPNREIMTRGGKNSSLEPK
jgi:hypothetical protein